MRHRKTTVASASGSRSASALTTKGKHATITALVGTESELSSREEPVQQRSGTLADTFAALVDDSPPVDWAAEEWTLGRTPWGL